MTKILIDGRLLSNKNTGISRYTEHLVKSYIDEYGYNNVEVVVDKKYVPIFKFRYMRTALKPFNIIHFFLFSFFLVKQNYEILHSPFYVNSFFRSKHKKSIVTVHDLMYVVVDNFFYNNVILNGICVRYFHFLVKRSIRNSNVVISVSQTTASDVLRNFGHVSLVCYEGINTLTKSAVSPQEFFGGSSGLKKDSFFLYAGNLRKHKNIDFLLKCFIKANTSRKLIIAGNYRGKLSSKCENIHFTGYVTDDELTWLYSNCSAFIFPSLYEGFGLPILEALSMGVKVFSSNSGALAEFPPSVVNFFDPRNEGELISLIERVDRIKIDTNATSLLLNRYHWDVLLKGMHCKLKEILKIEE